MESDARLIRVASLSLEQTEYDNWNGGTYFFTICLRLPLEVFVEIESQLEEIEKRLLHVSQSLWRVYGNDSFSAVSIYPASVSKDGTESPVDTLTQVPGFWAPKHFRLFISHCVSQKASVAALRDTFDALGITGFVAHEDIEPSREWEREIERALRTAEALLAVISDDFCASRWCDQEVGYALGRDLPVIPVRFNATPHGFIAKIQAISVPGGQLPRVAVPVARLLLLNTPRVMARMSDAVVAAVSDARSFAAAKEAVALLEVIPTLDSDQAKALGEAVVTNGQVRDAFGVPERIAKVLRHHGHRSLVVS